MIACRDWGGVEILIIAWVVADSSRVVWVGFIHHHVALVIGDWVASNVRRILCTLVTVSLVG